MEHQANVLWCTSAALHVRSKLWWEIEQKEGASECSKNKTLIAQKHLKMLTRGNVYTGSSTGGSPRIIQSTCLLAGQRCVAVCQTPLKIQHAPESSVEYSTRMWCQEGQRRVSEHAPWLLLNDHGVIKELWQLKYTLHVVHQSPCDLKVWLWLKCIATYPTLGNTALEAPVLFYALSYLLPPHVTILLDITWIRRKKKPKQ